MTGLMQRLHLLWRARLAELECARLEQQADELRGMDEWDAHVAEALWRPLPE
jgi:hypothetical protein